MESRRDAKDGIRTHELLRDRAPEGVPVTGVMDIR
jgi:hypothetical protein